MTTEEISQYIFDKKIPLSFNKNGVKYILWIKTGTYLTSTYWNKTGPYKFPIWERYLTNDITILYYDKYGNPVFSSKSKTLKDKLSEVLFWFEANRDNISYIRFFK